MLSLCFVQFCFQITVLYTNVNTGKVAATATRGEDGGEKTKERAEASRDGKVWRRPLGRGMRC